MHLMDGSRKSKPSGHHRMHSSGADQSHYECDDLVTTLKQCVSLSPELVAL